MTACDLIEETVKVICAIIKFNQLQTFSHWGAPNRSEAIGESFKLNLHLTQKEKPEAFSSGPVRKPLDNKSKRISVNEGWEISHCDQKQNGPIGLEAIHVLHLPQQSAFCRTQSKIVSNWVFTFKLA